MTLKQIEKLFNNLKGNEAIDDQLKMYGGEKIGEGQYRDVYLFKHDPRYVIKIERDVSLGMFCNVMEWRNYSMFHYTPYQKWLCPCHFINETGTLLIQRRAKPVTKSELPKKIPPFFTDKKIENWGRIGKKIVCVDYPFILPDQGKMKRVYWK